MKSRKGIFTKDFLVDQLKVTPKNYLEFYQSQWQKENSINLLFVLYKIIVAFTFAAILIISVVDLNDLGKSAALRAKWLIYLTNWQFSICTLQAVISAYLVTNMLLKTRKHGTYMQMTYVNKPLCNLYWIIYTIAANGALFVSIVFWTMVYDSQRDPLSAMNILTHAINALILLVDLFLVAHPIRLLHVYLPLFFNTVYFGFSIFYYLLGGTDKHNLHYVYAILNWETPLKTMKYLALVTVFLIVLHLFVYLYTCLRQYIAKKFGFNEKKHDITFSNLDQVMTPLKDFKEDPNHNFV